VKAILLVCGVVFSVVWLVWDFGEFNKWLKEYAPSLAFVGSIVALLSYRNSIRVRDRMQGAPL